MYLPVCKEAIICLSLRNIKFQNVNAMAAAYTDYSLQWLIS